MLNFNTINIIFITLLIGMIGYHFFHSIPVYAFIILLLAYLSFLFYGSYNVRSGFYLKTISAANTTRKVIAISFDDGPLPLYTPQILQVLKMHGVEAAFFCIGKRIKENEDLLKQVYDEGHVIGNHSYSHDLWFDLFPAQKMSKDLQLMNDAMQKVTGVKPRLFRPPYGVTNPNLKKAIEKNNFIPIGWTVRSMDTVAKDARKLLAKVTGSLKPGAIILFHDTSKVTLDMLPAFIQQVKQKGYEIVRLDKLLNLEPYA
ncbi:polysaccharide deacetylase family protein [Agriterribacter sp.]|uniref:polysaccharide deacetylase family protein n=1 Tax=Agriterribacter sp. TaxID=2821509 RepID=UPI002BA1706D|nr:polysaccharide deacetylase family protein [Agriterribacter sp.]HTN05831.1 polysaccharide deacetylase family protein [Agriterribacter sp.]